MNFKTTLVTISLLAFCFYAGAQPSIIHPATGTQTANLTAGTYRYFDSGGEDGDYGPNEGGTIELCPTNPSDEVVVLFTRSDLEVNGSTTDCSDFLRVAGDKSGNNGDYCGQPGNPPSGQFGLLRTGTRFSSQAGGCLIFTFSSDNSIQFDGWEAIIDVRAPMDCDCDPEVCGQRLLCEGFEDYVPYGVTNQSDQWIKPVSAALDGEVNRDLVFAGNQSLRMIARPDSITNVALLLGDSTSGRYRLSYQVLVLNLSTARFGLQHQESYGNWAYEMTLANSSGRFFVGRAAGDPEATFPYQPDQWNYFMQILDLDQDRAELWVNGSFVYSWTFSDGETTSGPASLNQLGALNFMGEGLYYVDNICLNKVDCSPMVCSAEDPCPVYINDFRFRDECEACCAGYTADEWVEESADPVITNFDRDRPWDPSINDKVFFSSRDSTLLVDFTFLDQLTFVPEDAVLSHYCPDDLTVEVVDERAAAGDGACINFPVTWIVRVGTRETSRYRLKVVVECTDPPVIDSIRLLATGQVFMPGDTVRVNTCQGEITVDAFEVFSQGCTDDNVFIETRLNDLLWLDPSDPSDPCYRGSISFTPFQCNNVGVAIEYVVEVTDSEGPAFMRPPNRVIPCVNLLDSLDLTGRVSAVTDNCGIMDTTYVDDLNDFDGCSGTIRRTWTVSDSCGNSTSLVQLINIFDNEPPTFLLPSNVTIEDAAHLDSLPLTGMIFNVEDNCAVADTSYVDDRTGLGGCEGEVLRTWIVRDQCGNETRQVQTIVVADAELPVFKAPLDTMVVCQNELSDLRLTGTVSGVADNTGIQDTAYFDDMSRFNGCSGTVVRTWTVTDVCGNQASATQRITLRDTIAPIVAVSGDITLTCLEELQGLDDINGIVLFTDDNCGLRDTSFTDNLRMINSCSYVVERTYRVTDYCGNVDSATLLIRVEDQIAPAFTPPPSVTVNFDQLFDLDITGRVSNVSDNCSLRDTSYTDRIIQEPGCGSQGWIIRTWRIEDWCGNVATSSQEIFVEVDPPMVEAGPAATISCQQPTVVLQGAASSDGARYTYAWTTGDGSILSGASTLRPTVNAAGTYSLTVLDNQTGCSATDVVIVDENNDLQPLLASKQDVSCPGGTTGSARITTQGGNPPYRISWSTGATTESIANLRAGRYSVTVSDQGNCQSTLVVNINEPDPLELAVTPLAVASCGGGADGEARVLATGGTSPYSYEWDNGETTATATMLTAGPHTVEVTDGNGCQETSTVTIDENIAQVSMGPLPGVCVDGAPLSLTTGQPAGGTYSGAGVSEGRFFPEQAGIGRHTVTYTYSANGCTNTAQAVVEVFELPSLTIGAQDPVCLNATPFEPQFIAPAGGRYSGQGIVDGLFDPAAVGAGSHPVLYVYRDPVSGCSNSAAALITVVEGREVSLEFPFSDTVLCQGAMLTIDPELTDFLEGDSFRWTVNGQEQPLPPLDQPLRLELPPGIYQVEGIASAAGSNCAGAFPDTARVRVEVLANPAPDVSLADTVLCSSVDRYRLRGGLPVGGSYDGPNVVGGNFMADRSGPGTYDFSYTIINDNGCRASSTFQIMVDVCTAAEEVGSKAVLRLFPNPSPGIFQLEMEGLQERELELRVTDQHGRQLWYRQLEAPGQTFNTQLDLSAEPAGVYWVVLKGERLFQVSRMVLVK